MLRFQIVDTAFCPETRITPGVQSRRPSVNRTAVMASQYEVNKIPEDGTTRQSMPSPSEELLNTAILHLSDCLECLG